MERYASINTGLRHPENRDVVFLAIYCDDSKPWIDYNGLSKEDRGKNIPLVFMIVRWDGYIGFAGGKVDEGETLIQALCRESKEEINFDVDPERAVLFCSFSANEWRWGKGNSAEGFDAFQNQENVVTRHIHCYEYKVTEEELRQAIRQAPDAEHFLAEIQGVFATQIANFKTDKDYKGFTEFRRNNFKATAGLELDYLIAKHDWLNLKSANRRQPKVT